MKAHEVPQDCLCSWECTRTLIDPEDEWSLGWTDVDCPHHGRLSGMSVIPVPIPAILPDHAMNEWLVANDIDPRTVVASGDLSIDEERKLILYTEFVTNENGTKIRVNEGDTGWSVLKQQRAAPMRKHPKHFGLL